MAYDPLLDKVMADYGQYLPQPAQGYASGGNVNVPPHEANLKAYEEALANRPKVEKEKYSYKGYPLTYKDGKWEEDVPDITTQVLVPMGMGSGTMGGYQPGGFGMPERGVYDSSGQPYKDNGIIGALNGGSQGQKYVYKPKTEKGYLLQYEYDPRLYEWDEYGRNVGMKPQLFGGSLGGLSMAGMGKDPLGAGNAVRGLARGGMVKGYAEGGLKEEDPYAYTPTQVPDMQQTMAPNFTPLQTGQVEPSGGGAIPMAPTMSPAMAAVNPELKALLDQYSTGTDYSADLRTARSDRKASEQAFNKTLDSLMTASDQGPSKAEMYFRLAAAFGTPSKTGAFGEGLAQAAGAMAETKKEERVAGTAKRKLGAEIAMKKQELALEGAKDTEKTLLGLQAESNKDKREFIKAQVKEYIDSGKPQSNAGKIAKDKGFKPGTPEYQTEVDKQVNLEIEKQVGAIKLQLQSGNIALANLGIAQEKAGREAIKLEPDERKSIRDDEDAMFAAKSTVKNLDAALSFVDQAFTNNAADQAAYKKLKQTNPNDSRVKATEELENLIGQNVVGSLKTTFGGNPTEGERRALQELGGLGSANKEVRKAIMSRAKRALNEAIDYRGARINKTETGGYRKKPEAESEGKK